MSVELVSIIFFSWGNMGTFMFQLHDLRRGRQASPGEPLWSLSLGKKVFEISQWIKTHWRWPHVCTYDHMDLMKGDSKNLCLWRGRTQVTHDQLWQSCSKFVRWSAATYCGVALVHTCLMAQRVGLNSPLLMSLSQRRGEPSCKPLPGLFFLHHPFRRVALDLSQLQEAGQRVDTCSCLVNLPLQLPKSVGQSPVGCNTVRSRSSREPGLAHVNSGCLIPASASPAVKQWKQCPLSHGWLLPQN